MQIFEFWSFLRVIWGAKFTYNVLLKLPQGQWGQSVQFLSFHSVIGVKVYILKFPPGQLGQNNCKYGNYF